MCELLRDIKEGTHNLLFLSQSKSSLDLNEVCHRSEKALSKTVRNWLGRTELWNQTVLGLNLSFATNLRLVT